MILTVTLNSAIDRVIFVEEVLLGQTVYAAKMVDSVGGKGFDTSLVLKTLGARSLALGFLAGGTGKQLERLLEGHGLNVEIAWVEGETRINHIFVERVPQRVSRLNTPGYTLTEETFQRFLDLFCRRLAGMSWAVASGSLPPGAPPDSFRTLARLAQERGVRMLVDTSGEPARQALLAPPSILKMNHHEFNSTFGSTASSIPVNLIVSQDIPLALCPPARQLLRRYDLPALVITCAANGILAVLPEGSLWARTPPQAETNAAGAGDAVSAALVWRLSQGDGWESALRWAAAASAAVVLTEATADCRWEDIQRIYPSTTVERLKKCS